MSMFDNVVFDEYSLLESEELMDPPKNDDGDELFTYDKEEIHDSNGRYITDNHGRTRYEPKYEASIFDNIVFDEYSLLEGQQAEEYKKRKAKEKEEAEKEYTKKAIQRSHSDHSHHYEYNDPEYKSQYQKAKEKEFEDSHQSKGIIGKIKTANERKKFNKNLEKEFEERQRSQIKRGAEAARMTQKYDNDHKELSRDDRDIARDAIKRHQRRHDKKKTQAKHESVLAMIESYECNYNY